MTSATESTSGHRDDGTTSDPAGFRHDALLYHSSEQMTAVAAPFLLDGLPAGDLAVIAVSGESCGPLRDAVADVVGNDPRVLVLERHNLYRARTPTAIRTFRKLAADRGAPGRRVRVVGEVDFGTTDADWQEWQRYEAVINASFAPLPLWGLCIVDATLPEPILTAVRHTHPQLLGPDGGRTLNPDFVDPAAYLRGLPVLPEPLEATPPTLAAEAVTDFIGLRHAVRAQLATVDGPEDLMEDFLLAVDEMASNSVRHGAPPAGLRLWTAPGTLVCTIRDSGPGPTDPFAGYGPAHGEDLSAGGMGLWLARQLCDHVAISRDAHGNSIRLTTHWT
nr:sensor histidine kinase [Modestobacter sp. DSM 44400]